MPSKLRVFPRKRFRNLQFLYRQCFPLLAMATWQRSAAGV